jgi:general secretion pathway protein A
MELRAVPEEDELDNPVSAMNGEASLADEAYVNGHAVAEGYPRLEVQRADPGQSYDDLKIDALSLNDYRNAPKRSGANQGQRPSWFRRTFTRTS